MKIASWNVNSINVRLPHVLAWLAENPVDALAIQETKVPDARFPHEAVAAAGYQVRFAGQKTYNGVAIISRQAGADPLLDLPGVDPAQKRFLALTVGDVRIVNVYVPNGAELDSEKYAYKLAWLDALAAWLTEEIQRHPRLVLLGDFNIAPDDRDVYDPELWRDRLLVSDPERAAFRKLQALPLTDCFRHLDPAGGTFSWWDYRGGAFRRKMGLRIDFIMATSALLAELRACHVDPVPRGWERPSDHAPVVAAF